MLRSDSVYKKKKANYRQLTLEKILVIINEFPHSKGMAVIVCKTCIVIKEFQTKSQPLVPNNKISSHSNTRHIPLNTGLLYALISLLEMKLRLTFLRVPCPPWD